MKRIILSAALLMGSIPVFPQVLLEDLPTSDPFIMADVQSNTYFLTGTGGDIYQSTDLEVWSLLPWALDTKGVAWVNADFTQSSPGQIWAPELYLRNGKYYTVATFTSPSGHTEGTNLARRSIHVLRSDKPGGPYAQMPEGDALYLPADKMAIDGTLWEEDGHVYMVYCYEWVQAKDGAVEYIEMKPDLTGCIGSSQHMFSCSDGHAWNNDVVTDGPFLFRTQTGRLGMVWTSWRSGVYVQGVAYSDNGKINGKWTQDACPITPDNHGHGMMFRTFDGQLLMSIHSNRNIDLNAQKFERHPVLFVMDDTSDQLRAVMRYRPSYSLYQPSAVVVRNSGFDYGTTQWICTSKAQNQGIAQNQSGAITGSFYENWDANSFVGEIRQQLSLPNGTYRVEAAAFRSYNRSGTTGDDDTAVCLFANDVTCPITQATPQQYGLTVHVTDGTLQFGLRSNRRHYQWMGIDNVKVTYYGPEFLSADTVQHALESGGAVYLRNRKTGYYLSCGNSWGTQAVLAEHPMDLYLHPLSNGKVAIDTRVSNGGENHYVSDNGYMDGSMAQFSIVPATDGYYTMSTNGRTYWGAATGSTAVSTQLATKNAAVEWELRSRDQLLQDMLLATEQKPVDATFLLRGADFGRNDSRIANWQGTFTTGGDVRNQCAQAPAASYDIHQTINVPNGLYEVRVQGFYRQGTATQAATLKQQGKEKVDAMLYANEEQVPLLSVFRHANHSSIPADAADRTAQGTIPSNLDAASVMFMRNLYANCLLVRVADGRLTLGVRKAVGNIPADNWTVFDNFELYYLGNGLNNSVNAAQAVPAFRTIYDMNGLPAEKSFSQQHKGVYIVNGRKIMR